MAPSIWRPRWEEWVRAMAQEGCGDAFPRKNTVLKTTSPSSEEGESAKRGEKKELSELSPQRGYKDPRSFLKHLNTWTSSQTRPKPTKAGRTIDRSFDLQDFWKDWPDIRLKATSADYYFESYNHYGVHEDLGWRFGVSVFWCEDCEDELFVCLAFNVHTWRLPKKQCRSQALDGLIQDVFQDGVTIPAFQQAILQSSWLRNLHVLLDCKRVGLAACCGAWTLRFPHLPGEGRFGGLCSRNFWRPQDAHRCITWQVSSGLSLCSLFAAKALQRPWGEEFLFWSHPQLVYSK